MLEILPQLLLNALITGSLYALMTAGLSLVYGLLRILNFAHGHIMMLGAYLFLFLCENTDLSLPLIAVCWLPMILGLAMLSYRLFIQPFSKSALILTLVSTIALSYILESSVAMLFGVNVKSYPGTFAYESFEFLGMFVTSIQLIIIGSAIGLLLILAALVHLTPFGRAIRALSENIYASQSLGLSRMKTTYVVFTIGVFYAAFAGVLLGYETNLSPTMGSVFTIKCFAAMILGGLGNLWGTIAGSYLLGLIENLVVGVEIGGYSIPSGYKDAISYLLILLLLLFFPYGLFNKKGRSA